MKKILIVAASMFWLSGCAMSWELEELQDELHAHEAKVAEEQAIQDGNIEVAQQQAADAMAVSVGSIETNSRILEQNSAK